VGFLHGRSTFKGTKLVVVFRYRWGIFEGKKNGKVFILDLFAYDETSKKETL